jgi:signal transduction histidine kinase
VTPAVIPLAASLGVALVIIVLLARERRRGRRHIAFLERLNEISQVLLTERNVRGVLRLVAESAGQLLSTDTAYIALLTPDGSRIVLEAATGVLAPLVGSVVPREGNIAAEVVRTGQRLVLNDVAKDGRGFRSLHEGVTLRASAAQPLMLKGRCIGVLGTENPLGAHLYEARDTDRLRGLASHTALVIESLRAIGELATRERRAALLNALNSRIRQTLELQTILESAVRELGAALGASRCFVRLRRGADLLAASSEWHAPEVPSVSARTDPTLPLQVAAIRERRTLETPDARSDERIPDGAPDVTQALAALVTPILLRDEAIGVIVFHQAGIARAWREEEIGLVEEVAAELAVGISNARLYRSSEDASRELAIKIGELERAGRMKAQFLANMSHELRTPLNAVIGFSEMLLLGAHGALTPDQQDALETVSRNGRHLLGLVNDILDLSKVEAGRMELHLTPTDIRELITSVLSGMGSLVTAKEHTVTLDLADGPLVVRADEIRVRQILFNLISNAVKFTPTGGQIVVRAVSKPMLLSGSGEPRREREAVWIAVSDHGIGIAPHDVPRLFTEFSQVDASHSRRYEGTGLGLALCKRFVELLGGQIGVESTLGRGSTFWLVLPVDGPPTAAVGV